MAADCGRLVPQITLAYFDPGLRTKTIDRAISDLSRTLLACHESEFLAGEKLNVFFVFCF